MQTQPSLRLTFHLKRKATYVLGTSRVNVLATPVPSYSQDDGAMAYNGITSFEEDGDTREYSLVDYTWRTGGNALEFESGCLPSHFVPPIATVLKAIHEASTATHLISLAVQTSVLEDPY
ncbi:hypothetical protein F442_09680 [Phytophthora nicotianae P10297]|uniref:Uncharacterized protein n=3 Tax=Phytophthora nicotianae TaxID=4792 RepID=V9F2F5_PHYNI|nr:hypothetical protein F443_09776 [Phytophthora nicotianae P1569]ETO74367.1 hypothetical protein F444_09872 [Phytophthora nicotianae P1976]ETP43609.1 hypothetical protein F442_09680 [Phytophthora nicotianae P10297]